jgi:hypothetical protein
MSPTEDEEVAGIHLARDKEDAAGRSGLGEDKAETSPEMGTMRLAAASPVELTPIT